MNILYIAPYKYLKPKAGGHFCMYYTQKYLGKYCNLFIAGVQANDTLPDENFTVLPILKNGALARYANPFLFFTLKKVIKEKNIDTIILEHPYLAWLVYLLKKSCKITWIIRSENIEYLRFKSFGKKWWRLLKIYENWAHNQADIVLCITEDDRRIMEENKTNNSTKYIDMPYGTEVEDVDLDKLSAKKQICSELKIPIETKIIFFNGSLDYMPNRLGLDGILNEINPFLLEHFSNYKIVICGNRLPDSYQKLEAYKNKNIVYCGFVDDIATYFKGADVFLNPIIGGGGIKTKLVEALAHNTVTISSQDGANGINTNVVGEMLHIISNNNWIEFAEKIIEILQKKSLPNTPKSYYDYYNWDINTKRLISIIENQIS